MNRKETQLLVENWRKVLDEGLYESDPEILEEINIKKALGTAGLLATMFASQFGGLGSAAAQGGDGVQDANAPAIQKVVDVVQDATGKKLHSDDLYRYSRPDIEKAVKTCIDKRTDEIIKMFKENTQHKKWLSAYETTLEVSQDDIFKKAVFPAISKVATDNCVGFVTAMLQVPGMDDNAGSDYFTGWEGMNKAKSQMQKVVDAKGIDAKVVANTSFKTDMAIAAVEAITGNLGVKAEKKMWGQYLSLVKKLLSKLTSKGKNLPDPVDPEAPSDGIFGRIFGG